MAGEKDFQKQVQRIGGLVHDLEAIADPAARSAAKELVQTLMDLHGLALDRILEIVFQSGDGGTRVIDELGQDPLVSSVLLLYGLHPEDMQTRVEKKLADIRSRLFKMGAEAKLVSVSGGEVRLRATVDGHSCGSTARTVQATLEEAIYEAAPDLASLVVEGLEEPTASGFVALASLLGPPAAPALPLHHAAALGREALD